MQLEWNPQQNRINLKLHKEAILIPEAQIQLYLLGSWNLEVCSCCFTCYQASSSKRTAVHLSSSFSARLHKNSSVVFLPVTCFHFSINYRRGKSLILYTEASESHLWPLCSGTEMLLHVGENKIREKCLAEFSYVYVADFILTSQWSCCIPLNLNTTAFITGIPAFW